MISTNRVTKWLDERFYPRCDSNWDDALFRMRLLDVVRHDHVVLDLGAGAGIVSQMNFRGLAGTVVGLDVDPRVANNQFLDVAWIGDGTRIPSDAEHFDVVFSDNVLEHLEHPEDVFREVHRVLKPGGRFLVKTPNRRHYMPMISRITPVWFHRYYNRLRGRQVTDTFPTHYRANSPETLRRLAEGSGLKVVAIESVEGRPEYLRLHPLLYLLGIAYERLVNKFRPLHGFRVVLIAQFVKGRD